MRILKAFVTSLLIIIVVGGGFLLIFREVVLYMTTYQVKQSLIQVRDLDKRQAYSTECLSKGSDRDQNGRVHHTQLRFIDENSYVLEAICNQMDHAPVEILTETLPPFAQRQLGKSGWRWDEESGINFVVLNRVGSVSIIDREIVTSRQAAVIDGSLGPPGACVSYGYQCCDVNMQMGRGELVSSALDCPKGCYQNCEDRPLILSFNTQPYYNKITRTLQLTKQQPVTFSFVVSPNQDIVFIGFEDSDDPVQKVLSAIEVIFGRQEEEELVEVTIDFGDGQTESFTGLRGQVEHRYDCAGGSCTYDATIRVVKEGGIESYSGPQNVIQIQVN
ncbi:MAG: hypothetical protein XD95_0298 [Microgenomates bacterium 39_7]|nr:MAG: hypothetical protein XD95_0298 [Microgenomates bacterium 39_7]